jgi:hypothetical protein
MCGWPCILWTSKDSENSLNSHCSLSMLGRMTNWLMIDWWQTKGERTEAMSVSGHVYEEVVIVVCIHDPRKAC